MKLDILIKLVKLANNNPNEYEANSAARRVCKMIAENNYRFTDSAATMPPSFNSIDMESIMKDMQAAQARYASQWSYRPSPYTREPSHSKEPPLSNVKNNGYEEFVICRKCNKYLYLDNRYTTVIQCGQCGTINEVIR